MRFPHFRALVRAAGLLIFLTFLTSAHAQSLVNHTDPWRYRKGTSAPQADWKMATETQLDASWLTGKGGFGFADNSPEVSLCQTILSDMDGNYSTVAMRRTFQVTTAPDSTLHLVLTMDWDDGFIAWLDGIYIASENSPGAPAEPAFSAVATASHESSHGNKSPQPAVEYDLGPVGTRLTPGSHILAIVGMNSSKSGSSDFGQVADLTLKATLTNCVTGAISADTRLEGTNSICGSITILSGATVTIAPSARIELADGANITVADGGRLMAEGNPTNRILFTRTDGGQRWGGIVVNGSVGSPETRITYADVEFNGATAIHSSSGTVYLDHLNFLTTEHQYVSLDSSSFIVSDCYFPAGSSEFEPGHGNAGIKQGGHGIFSRNFFGGTIGYSDIIDFTGNHRPGPIVHFINNVFMGGQDDGLDLDGTDAWVESNIFLHIHRNGDTPDSSSAVSGGNFGAEVSAVTIIGNLFFDCDNAATAKQGNFFTLLNNTIVHMTKIGGIDGASGAVVVRDTTPSPTTFARGMYLENNIITDVDQLVRNYDATQTSVTFSNNLISLPWTGPGASNVVAQPNFVRLPTVPDTQFTNWVDAQQLWNWLKLQPGSPGAGSGWEGTDQGGYTPASVLVSAQVTRTNETSARIDVGYVRTGSDIPVSGWPEGTGYTHYKWRLDTNAWSDPVTVGTPIELSNLPVGSHYVEVSGERDSGLFQDDPLFGVDAIVTRSATWQVGGTEKDIEITGVAREAGKTTLDLFLSIGSYTLQYKSSLNDNTWSNLQDLSASSSGVQTVTDVTSAEQRFYRVVSKP
jgi:hypothetical protein